MNVTVPPDVIRALRDARHPLVMGHVGPDADAVGSMLGLARALPGGRAAVVLPDRRVGRKLQFLLDLAPGVPVADEGRIAGADVVLVLDTANPERINPAGSWDAIASKFVVNIDHHITNTDFGRVNWVLDGASSTCELVYRLLSAAGWPIDGPTATALYAGICADTGGFSLPNVTADVFDVAAALVRSGADVARVGERLLRSQQPSEFDLIRTVYHNTRIVADGQIAYSTLTHQEILAAGCTPEDIDDQVSIPRSLSGIRLAILFSEGVPGRIRINLRGENGTRVLLLAARLGGGGHPFSAGVRIRGAMDEVVARVLEAAVRHLRETEVCA